MNSSLHDLLDAFLSGDCPPEAFLSELSAYCDATPDSSWEVLALLDQYHRRGKLSADHFRAFRREIEFHALGIADRGLDQEQHESVADAAAPAAAPEAEEVLRLRTALEAERERSERYRQRLATKAIKARQLRSIGRSRALVSVPPVAPAPAPALAPNINMLVVSAPAGPPARIRGRRRKALLALWRAQQRHLQHPRTWTSAAVLLAAVTVIAGSSSYIDQVPNAQRAATTPVTLEAAPELPAAILEPRTISLASEKFVVLPGSSTATIQVDRTGEIGDAARFRWWTQPAGAKPGRDYIGKSQVAQFDAGEASVQLPVRILANPRRTHTEMFYVVIGDPDDADLGPNRRAAVFIMRAK